MDITYARLRALFDHCVDLPDGERESWMDTNVTDANQRIELELMLVADRGQTGFLQRDVAEHIELLGDAAGPEFNPESLIGRRFGAFQLQRLIGRGGQGTVFLAERVDSDFAQTAAVKLLSRGIHDSDEHRRFRREREILARFEHAGGARLIDGGVSGDGVPYLIMEYVEGVSIEQWCEDQVLDLRARVALFGQLCDVVAAAHRALIVHRDLKPSNVLVTPEGQVKVLDFGIARLLVEDETQSQTAVPIMTPGYGAPEQARGGVITLATDVHALGMLLRVLLTNSPPPMFPGELTPLPELVPPELRWVIAKACAMESERRYRDAAELGDDIARFLGARPVLAHPPSRWYVARKFVNRHRGSVLTTVAVLLGILASAGVAIWQAKVARAQAQRAEAARDFLLSVFESANEDLPEDQRPTPDVLARQAAQRLESDQTLTPEMRAEFLGTLAQISFNGNDFAAAIAQGDHALKLLDGLGEQNSRRHVEIEVNRFQAMQRMGQGQEAEAGLRARLPVIRAKQDKAMHVGVAAYVDSLVQNGNLQGTVELAEEHVRATDNTFGPDTRESLDSKMFLAYTLLVNGRTKDAVAHLNSVHATWNSRAFPTNRSYSKLLQLMSYASFQLGDRAHAETVMREELALNRRIMKAPHERIANNLQNLAVVVIDSGNFAEGERYLKESASMYGQLFPADHPNNISSQVTVGNLYNVQRRFSEGEAILGPIVALCKNQALSKQEHCGTAMRELSHAYAGLERNAQALQVARNYHDFALQLYGAKHLKYAQALQSESTAMLGLEQWDAALQRVDEAIAIFTASGLEQNYTVSAFQQNRAKALLELGQPEPALQSIDLSKALQEKQGPSDWNRRASILALRIEILRRLNRDEESAAEFKALLEIPELESHISAARLVKVREWQKQ